MKTIEHILIRFLKEEHLFHSYKKLINHHQVMENFQKNKLMFLFNINERIYQSFDQTTTQLIIAQKEARDFQTKLLDEQFNIKLNYWIYLYLINDIIEFMKINKIHQRFIDNLKTYYKVHNFHDILLEMIENDVSIIEMISGTFVSFL